MSEQHLHLGKLCVSIIIKFVSIAFLAVSTVFLISTFSNASEKTIKIGVIGSMSGKLASYGYQIKNGLEIGLEKLTNGTMMVAGKRLILIYRDTGTKPYQGIQQMTAFFEQDNVDLVVGGTSSGVVSEMLPIVEKCRKIFIIDPASAATITGEAWNRYIFRTGRNSDHDAIGNAIILGNKDTVVATIVQDYAYGRDAVASLDEALSKKGGEIIHKEFLPINTRDFTPAYERIVKAFENYKEKKKAIYITWAGGGNPLGKIVRLNPHEHGIVMVQSMPSLAEAREFKKIVQNVDLKGVTFYYYTLPQNPMNDWLVEEYKKRFHGPPDYFVPGGVAIASALVTALEKTQGDTDTEKLISVLEGMEFDSPSGKRIFRKEDHQALQSLYHYRPKIVEGLPHAYFELIREIKIEEIDLPIRNRR